MSGRSRNGRSASGRSASGRSAHGRNASGRSREFEQAAERGRSKSRSRPEMLAAAETAKRGPKRSAYSKRDRAKKGNRRRSASPDPSGPSLQTYFDDAVKSATSAAKGIFEHDDDFDDFDDGTEISDEISFVTPTESNYTGKYSANDRSMEVAAVSTEAERKKLQQQQPEIATFRLKKNGRPRVVRNLVKQLKRDEEKYQKAARALQEAEENMWKTKWKLYNLAEDFGLLCGNFGTNVVEEEEVNDMVAHDNVYDDDDYDSDSYAPSEYSYDR